MSLYAIRLALIVRTTEQVTNSPHASVEVTVALVLTRTPDPLAPRLQMVILQLVLLNNRRSPLLTALSVGRFLHNLMPSKLPAEMVIGVPRLSVSTFDSDVVAVSVLTIRQVPFPIVTAVGMILVLVVPPVIPRVTFPDPSRCTNPDLSTAMLSPALLRVPIAASIAPTTPPVGIAYALLLQANAILPSSVPPKALSSRLVALLEIAGSMTFTLTAVVVKLLAVSSEKSDLVVE